ncbi:hypothetical protein JW824_10555 [bacterium]|nr:hypothetical protein [bacterium]
MKCLTFITLTLFIIGFKCPTEPIGPELGEEFSLEYGQSVKIQNAGLRIKFKSVVSDSRCPIGLECFVAGNAQVIIQVSDMDITLNTNQEPKEVDFFIYTIRLIDVEPYPVVDEIIELKDYNVKLIITRKFH